MAARTAAVAALVAAVPLHFQRDSEETSGRDRQVQRGERRRRRRSLQWIAGLLESIIQCNPSVSYLELIDQLRDAMQNKLGVTQTPTLLGQEYRQNSPILAPWDIST